MVDVAPVLVTIQLHIKLLTQCTNDSSFRDEAHVHSASHLCGARPSCRCSGVLHGLHGWDVMSADLRCRHEPYLTVTVIKCATSVPISPAIPPPVFISDGTLERDCSYAAGLSRFTCSDELQRPTRTDTGEK